MIRLAFNLAARLAKTDGLTFAREKRYDCRECRDTGWVTIFRPEVVRQATIDADAIKAWLTCVVLCTCKHSERNAPTYRSGKRRGEALPIFGDRPWHINAHHPDAMAQAALYEHKPPNFNEEFTEWS